MDKLQKLLKRVSREDRVLILETINQLHNGNTDNLSIVKLSGEDKSYRVRVKHYRIIFHYDAFGDVSIDRVRKRNENTYKNL